MLILRVNYHLGIRWLNKELFLRLNITADFSSESGIDEVLSTLSKTKYFQFFKPKSYGDDLEGICIILMCQNPALNLRKRIRFSRKEKKIYMDVMLNLDDYSRATLEWRLQNTITMILNEISENLKKYNLSSFDVESFMSDLKQLLLSALPHPKPL